MAIAIVGGALANKPHNGGEAWVRLSWTLGLRRLGFDAYLVEQLASEDCVDAAGDPAGFATSANRAWFESVVADFGLEGRAALLCDGGSESAGLGPGEVVELAAEADVLFNLSGNLSLEPLLGGPRVSAYVDLDPGFTQAWHADAAVPFSIPAHDRYVSVGLNVGRPGCPIPDCGLAWISTLPPVLREEWTPRQPPPGPPRFTTVARWRNSFGPPRIGGRQMGLKHHQFRRFAELPERVGDAEFEVALDIDPGDVADLEALLELGWRVVAPREAAGTPRRFREYVAASAAEFSVAQGAYAEAGSGWFSDRAAAYLASGRPALGQDTGIGAALRADAGFVAFSSLEEAVRGAERIVADYEEQSEAAAALARERLDSDLVLGRLLDEIGVAA